MDYLHGVLKNNYLEWKIKEPEKKSATLIRIADRSLEVKKNVFLSTHHVFGLMEEFRRIFKEAKTLKSIYMHPQDKNPLQLKQTKI